MKSIVHSAIFVAVFFVAAPSFGFGPCEPTMPSGMSYVPSAEACDGNAAIILSGKYINAFSVVVRDCNNNDRDPCHPNVGSCGTNYSSPFKVQKTFQARIHDKKRERRATLHCLKEPGNSKVFELVRRITVKLRNPVRAPSDIVKVCLRTRTQTVREVSILSTYGMRRPGNIGYNSACKTQKYLGCSIAYADICPKY